MCNPWTAESGDEQNVRSCNKGPAPLIAGKCQSRFLAKSRLVAVNVWRVEGDAWFCDVLQAGPGFTAPRSDSLFYWSPPTDHLGGDHV